MVNKRVQDAALGCSLKNDRMISVRFQGKPFNITVIQMHAPTSNAEEAEVEWFSEDLQDLSRINTPKRCPFHYRGLECKRRKSRNTWSNRHIWPWSTVYLTLVSTPNWLLPRAFAICLCRDWTLCCYSSWPSVCPEGLQGGEWGTLCSRETCGAGLWIVRYFQEWISWSHSLHLLKKQRNQRSNCQYLLDHRKSKSVPEKCLLLPYWLRQRLWLCGSQSFLVIYLKTKLTLLRKH